MIKIFLSLWSNILSKQENLDKAIEFLRWEILDIKLSKVYETKAFWEINQENFLNMVVKWSTNLEPKQLLNFIKSIEEKIWREKTYRWWPRKIDIDILFYWNEILKEEDLIVPHIWIKLRDFVLKPLLDLEPDFVHPVYKKTVKELYNNINKNTLTII